MDPITNDLADMFPDELLYQAPVSFDFMGAPTGLGPTQRIPALASQKTQNVKNRDGQMVRSTIAVRLCGVFDVDERGAFTLPARFSPRSPRAVAVYHGTDEGGPHHETVYF